MSFQETGRLKSIPQPTIMTSYCLLDLHRFLEMTSVTIVQRSRTLLPFLCLLPLIEALRHYAHLVA